MIKAHMAAQRVNQRRIAADFAILRPSALPRLFRVRIAGEMKRLIQRELQRRKLRNNAKLGVSDIRDIEFIVQYFQLVRDGRERALNQRKLRKALDVGRAELFASRLLHFIEVRQRDNEPFPTKI